MNRSRHTARLEAHYRPLLEAYGSSHRAVDWGSAESQATRFRVLLELGDWKTASILDVGCGTGHLAGYLSARHYAGRYTGIDVLPGMVARARAAHPGLRFLAGDIVGKRAPWKADYVLASGIFTFSDLALMRRTITAMFASCTRATAFNALSAWSKNRQRGELHADPLATLRFCRGLSPKVALRHDYLPHDFTVYLYR